MIKVRVRISKGNTATMLESFGDVVRLGRLPDCEITIDSVAFPMVSGVHARIQSVGQGFVLVHLSGSNKTFVNDAAVNGSVPVRAGDRVRLGQTGPIIEIVAIESSGRVAPPPVAPPPVAPPHVAPPHVAPPHVASSHGQTVQADSRQMALIRGTAQARRFDIGSGGVIGREARAVQYHLDHANVSRQHASLAVDRGRVVLADLGSANGTFVNGRRMTRPVALKQGDRIDIGPFSLRLDGLTLVSRSRSNNIELIARGLRRVVKERATGKPLTLLENINLVVRPREFICLLGPSGSGKSTLLSILSGRNAPDAGMVYLNGADLYSHFEALKGDIAVVPQKESLHDSLAVGTALRYTAELRLPPDLSSTEIHSSVTDILDIVGLTERRGTLVRHLSGGQIKRISLANELVSRPSLLFLDEVTSGLDEQTDRDVMELFRQVADGGKTVVCITHNLANVEATCHLVLILTEGGRLAFIGTPDEAKSYFGIARLGDVYRKLATRDREEWHQQFRGSPYYRRYVADRLPSDPLDDEAVSDVQAVSRGSGGIRQTWILIRRYAAIWRGDIQALGAMLGQSLLVAILLGSVFGNLNDVSSPDQRVQQSLNMLLLLSVSCFWFGCNTAAKELVKERPIFLRERDFNLRVGAYFASKFAVLALIAALQATVLFVIVRAWCQPAGSAPEQCFVLNVLAVTGTAIGLLISAMARSEEVATALLPIVVIPQMILADVVAPLSGPVSYLAKGSISVYWAQRALEGLASDADRLFSALPQRPFHGLWELVPVLGHAAAGVIATIVVLRRTDGKTRAG